MFKKKKDLNIIYIIPRPDGGGAEFLVSQLAAALNKKGFNVSVIYFHNPSRIRLKSYEYCLNLRSYKDLRAIWYLRKLILKLKKKNKTIVHANLTWPLYFLPFSTFGVKTINFYTEHNTFNKRRKFIFLKPIEKYIYSKYFKIICISNGTKKNLLNWLGGFSNNRNIIVVPNGSRLFNFIKRKKINSNKLKLISIGSLTKQKGFDIALKAIFLLKNRIEKYTIIGEGKQNYKLLTLVNELGLSNKIHFTGHIKNFKSHLSSADIGLVPSRWEGFGLVSVEMLSTGMPLVCSNVLGLNEVVKNCPAVQLVKPENPQALARGLINTVKRLNKKDYMNLAMTAKKHSQKYDMELFFQKYIDLYLDAAFKNK